MTVRSKLILALAPLAAALVALGVVSVLSVRSGGRIAERMLRENLRSVLAAERMKDAVQRLHREAELLRDGRGEGAGTTLEPLIDRLEHALVEQEDSVFEVDEREPTARMRALWNESKSALRRLASAGTAERARDLHRTSVEPDFRRLEETADAVIALNQRAMRRKIEDARSHASDVIRALVLASVGGLLVSLSLSILVVRRVVRRLGAVADATDRVAEGNLGIRLAPVGRDEIARLARHFDVMALRLEEAQRSAQRALAQVRGASQATIESMPDPVVVFAADGTISILNRAARDLLNVPDAETPARLAGDDAHEVRVAVEQARDRVQATGRAVAPRSFRDALRVESGGRVRFHLARATPVLGPSGEAAGAVVVLHDVTELRRFDAAREDLVATAAHELRTPLTSLRMALDLCLEREIGPLNARQESLLGAGREECERLQGTVDALLDLARIQAGQIDLRRQEVALDEIVGSVIRVAGGAASERSVRLESVVPAGAAPVWADPDRIQVVLANLVGNAIRHSPPRGTVTISAEARSGPVGGVELFVDDEGRGVPEDARPFVFDRFYRVAGSEPGGVGLGLAIARGIVEAHGGTIGVGPSPAGGSRFRFTIPGRSREHDGPS